MSQIKSPPTHPATVTVSHRGANRWRRGHPWIYRSDIESSGPATAGIVSVTDPGGRFIGQALYSPSSEIRLRLLEPTDRPIDHDWWVAKLRAAAARRVGIDATAWRMVHAEGDGLPSLVVDRYDKWLVVQLLSAGLETRREEILEALLEVSGAEGILLRNDPPVRRQEGLPQEVVAIRGTVPDTIPVTEGSIRYLAAPWTGQKTGAFLDQRPNRIRASQLIARGAKALDCFAYHGSFALHLAGAGAAVVAIDSSEEAIERGRVNASLNNFDNIEWRCGNAFELLRGMERTGERFDFVIVDPPAFAKSRPALGQALTGYQEINLRAMRLLRPGGMILTASCSWHLRRPAFYEMIANAAADSGRRLRIVEYLGQGVDHPELITVPETGYLKGLLLEEIG